MKKTSTALTIAVLAALVAACGGSDDERFVLGEANRPLQTDCKSTSFSEESGVLADGTPWGWRKPANWNGVLINDLDYLRLQDSTASCALLSRGYALSGLNRNSQRTFNWDPAQEQTNLFVAISNFEAKNGKPKRTVQLGSSGGGFLALMIAENYATRVDGVVAKCAHEAVPMWNGFLDSWFVLQKLIAPDLPITGFRTLAEVDEAAAKWQAAIVEAQKTPLGRARIALAVAMGQWPAWTQTTAPRPDSKNVEALQLSMYNAVLFQATMPGGLSRFMMEHAGGVAEPRAASWNDGADYEKFFSNADIDYANAVRSLFRAAGRDVAEDIAVLQRAPRIKADASAVSFWNDNPNRTVKGVPKVPVMRIHEVGDWAAQPSLLDAYAQKMRANGGDSSLYRTAIAEGPGHCVFNAAETTAAVETLMTRLDTGNWPSVEPSALNDRGTRLVPSEQGRFFIYQVPISNRAANRP